MTAAAGAVVAVVLNWNKSDETIACVRSLQRQTWPDLSILVIDNGSSADQLALLRANLGDAQLIRHETNLGFTGGVNTGLRHASEAGADYIWLVNNDLVAPADTLRRLVAAIAAEPAIGLASPVIRNADTGGTIDFCGGFWSGNRQDFSTTVDPDTYRRWEREMPGQIWLAGTALLVRRQAYERIGLFDDRFFAYWEDNDYSMRSIRSGFRNIMVLDAEVFHRSGVNAPGAPGRPPHFFYYMARNEVLFWKKHGRSVMGLKQIWWTFERQFRQALRLRGSPDRVAALELGLWDGLWGRVGAYDPHRRLSPPGQMLFGLARPAIALCRDRGQAEN